MLHATLNATRHSQKPLPQPTYKFSQVPRPLPDLSGSSLQFVDNREDLQTCMAEMLLLCKEAARQRRFKEKENGGDSAVAIPATTGSNNCASKPLSLEYLADRIDIDDPIWGYLVRSSTGMLQGFITVTTFTNYQATFQWDSLNEAAFGSDCKEMERQRLSGLRKWDSTGALTREMQRTVRAGDIWSEGIVWPRIAEISLLGALGCGRTLVNLVIEDLEYKKATGKFNYDYVVLQATDNSIPFYESMGFVRVGATTEEEVSKEATSNSEGSTSGSNKSGNSSDGEEQGEEPVERPRNSIRRLRELAAASKAASDAAADIAGSESVVAAEPVADDSPENLTALAVPEGAVMTPNTLYQTKKGGETPATIAKKFRVDAWDLCFLNQRHFPQELTPSTKFLKATLLHVPLPLPKVDPSSEEKPTWYTAKNNETPKIIAKKFGLNCLQLVHANCLRLPGLNSTSRLKEATRVKISHLHIQERPCKPYCHWSFPDDRFEEGEPSYLMARKLQRRQKGKEAKQRPFLSSLAVTVEAYQTPSLLLPPSPVKEAVVKEAASIASPEIATCVSPVAPKSSLKKKFRKHPDEPVPPKRPCSPFFLFQKEERRGAACRGKSMTESAKITSELWKNLPAEQRAVYISICEENFAKYKVEKERYDRELAAFRLAHPELEISDEGSLSHGSEDGLKESTTISGSIGKHDSDDSKPAAATVPAAAAAPATAVSYATLFNQVVRLKPGAITEGTDDEQYTYWYVLNFVPDLKWCHLVPMVQHGFFGNDRPKATGRPRWKLVDESLGHEVDISSSFCIPVRARTIKNSTDADKEEWDIIDDGTPPTSDRGRWTTGRALPPPREFQPSVAALTDSSIITSIPVIRKEPAFRKKPASQKRPAQDDARGSESSSASESSDRKGKSCVKAGQDLRRSNGAKRPCQPRKPSSFNDDTSSETQSEPSSGDSDVPKKRLAGKVPEDEPAHASCGVLSDGSSDDSMPVKEGANISATARKHQSHRNGAEPNQATKEDSSRSSETSSEGTSGKRVSQPAPAKRARGKALLSRKFNRLPVSTEAAEGPMHSDESSGSQSSANPSECVVKPCSAPEAPSGNESGDLVGGHPGNDVHQDLAASIVEPCSGANARADYDSGAIVGGHQRNTVVQNQTPCVVAPSSISEARAEDDAGVVCRHAINAANQDLSSSVVEPCSVAETCSEDESGVGVSSPQGNVVNQDETLCVVEPGSASEGRSEPESGVVCGGSPVNQDQPTSNGAETSSEQTSSREISESGCYKRSDSSTNYGCLPSSVVTMDDEPTMADAKSDDERSTNQSDAEKPTNCRQEVNASLELSTVDLSCEAIAPSEDISDIYGCHPGTPTNENQQASGSATGKDSISVVETSADERSGKMTGDSELQDAHHSSASVDTSIAHYTETENIQSQSKSTAKGVRKGLRDRPQVVFDTQHGLINNVSPMESTGDVTCCGEGYSSSKGKDQGSNGKAGAKDSVAERTKTMLARGFKPNRNILNTASRSSTEEDASRVSDESSQAENMLNLATNKRSRSSCNDMGIHLRYVARPKRKAAPTDLREPTIRLTGARPETNKIKPTSPSGRMTRNSQRALLESPVCNLFSARARNDCEGLNKSPKKRKAVASPATERLGIKARKTNASARRFV